MTIADSPHPELYNANTAAPVPTPFTPVTWWRCLFRRWSEPEFVQLTGYSERRGGYTQWESKTGAIYRETDRRTGKRRYSIVTQGWGRRLVDAAAWEHNQTLIFT